MFIVEVLLRVIVEVRRCNCRGSTLFLFKALKHSFSKNTLSHNTLTRIKQRIRMIFGLYEHFVVATALLLIFTRKTRLFYLCVFAIAYIQWAGIDYLRENRNIENQCAKYSINFFGRIFEACVRIKKESTSD